MRQAMFDTGVDELVTIEARQAVVGAEPQEAARIRDDFVDSVAGQTISRGVSAYRELFGFNRMDSKEECEEKRDRQNRTSFHSHGNA